MRVWRFRVAPGREREFERVNGPHGEWARLFEQAPGFLGTYVKPIKRSPGEYQTVDRWESREAWDAFRRDFAEAYERLDRELESLTTSETFVSEEDFLAPESIWKFLPVAIGTTLLYLEVTRRGSPEMSVLERIGLSVFLGVALTAMSYVMYRYVMPMLLRFTSRLKWRKKKAAGDRSPAATTDSSLRSE